MIAIPQSVVDEARTFARDTVDRAIEGLIGIVDRAIRRRQSYGFAHEQALFHRRMAESLATLDLVGKRWRVRRQKRLAVRWEAKAWARTPQLAGACGLACPDSGVMV